MYEYWSYVFKVSSPTKLDRDEIIAAMEASNFKLIDHSVVPAEFWRGFIPQEIIVGITTVPRAFH